MVAQAGVQVPVQLREALRHALKVCFIVTTSNYPVISCDNIQINQSFLMFLAVIRK